MTLGAERVKMNMQRSIDTEVRHIWNKKNLKPVRAALKACALGALGLLMADSEIFSF